MRRGKQRYDSLPLPPMPPGQQMWKSARRGLFGPDIETGIRA